MAYFASMGLGIHAVSARAYHGHMQLRAYHGNMQLHACMHSHAVSARVYHGRMPLHAFAASRQQDTCMDGALRDGSGGRGAARFDGSAK